MGNEYDAIADTDAEDVQKDPETHDFARIGCFADKPSRAISGRVTRYPPNEAVKKCFERARREGNEYFSVQYNTQCFTSRNAGATYAKYGAANGCKNGRGGAWKNTVYHVISSFARIGCFADKPSRAISGRVTRYPPNVAVKKCFERARREGNEYFSVQYNT